MKKRMRNVLLGALAAALMISAQPNVALAKEASEVTNQADFSTDVIYQIITDRFVDGDTSNNPSQELCDKGDMRKYHGGDWAGIKQKIEDGYLTNLGVSALWISSPVENIMTIDPSNQSASYHGYWAKDFFCSNSAFGSMEDFQQLVTTAHNHGIKVVIDFAPNHTSTAELGDVVFPEDGALYRNGSLVGTFSNDPDHIFNHESWTDYSTIENGIYHSMYGLADLNHLNGTVDTYMKDAIDQWLDMGVDGIRVDAVKHMPAGWQTNWLSSIYQEHNVFVFGEWFTGGTGNDGDMTTFANNSGMSLLDFRFANAVRAAVGEKSMSMEDFYQVVVDTQNDFDEVNDQVTFIDNHDMPRITTLAKENQASVNEAYVLLLTSRGVPTIYYGSEQYLTGSDDPYNRGDMTRFDTNSKAYRIISALAPLRKTNTALAYGETCERWMNDDVLIFERQFGDDVALVAINRNQESSCHISGLYTNLPKGKHVDVLNGVMNGADITVRSKGAVSEFDLAPGACAVWEYHTQENGLQIGDVDPGMGIAGNTVAISGSGFGTNGGSVSFGTTEATVVSWSNTCVEVQVPAVGAGEYEITVSAGGASDSYAGFRVLSGPQVCARFQVENAQTDYGSNVYLVGNVAELGNWDPDQAIGPFYNATGSICNYPNWFFDVSVPAGAAIEYKFIKKDGAGNVVWESGSNHTYTLPESGTTTITCGWQN